MPLSPGSHLGPYEVLALIGAGGMGEVYRARDPRLNREVAIKVLPHDRVTDESRRQRFVQEAKAASALNHPHIVTIHEIESANGIDFIVMEYVRGKSLDALIPRQGMRLNEALRIGIAVADAVAAAHARGIIHRDLKPANVMVGTDGAVKVLDFGLAKLLHEDDAPSDPSASTHLMEHLTDAGQRLGTLAYMAPEQASGETVDARADIFSFGAMLYEMSTGQRAFRGKTPADTLSAVLQGQPTPPSTIVPTLPHDLERTMLRCLRKDPARRFQTMADLKVDLAEIKETSESATGLAGAPHVHTDRRRLIAGLAGTTLLIAAVAGVGSWLWGRRTTPALPDRSVARLTLKLEGQGAHDLSLYVNHFCVPLALSPDGTRLVFLANGPKGHQLFLRDLAGVEAKALPGTEGARTPFFSPDGRWVAFWRAEDRILRKVSVSGGTAIEIASTEAPLTALWGVSDEIIIESNSGTLWSIPADGGKPQAIVVRDRSEGETISLRARIPGRNDLLVASLRRGEAWLEVLSRETGKRRRLLRGGGSAGAIYAARTGHLVYADADTLFAVAVDSARFEPVGAPVPVIDGIDHFYGHTNVALSESGTVVYLPAERVREEELVWRDRAGNVRPVPGGRGPFSSLAPSPDGRELVVGVVEGTTRQVWIIDVERGAKRLLVSEGNSYQSIWSRDGAYVTYASLREEKAALYRRRADGTGSEERLLETRLDTPSPEDWSPDGRSLLFTAYTGRGDSDIWIYSGGEPVPFIASPFNEASPRFSPDGRFVAFEADDGGVSHVYIQPFPGPGRRTNVSVEEGGAPRWTGGQQLIFHSGDRMMAVAVQTAPVLRVGEPQLLSEQDRPPGLAQTRDGLRFLSVSPRTTVDGPLELGVVLNWFDELERLAPHPH